MFLQHNTYNVAFVSYLYLIQRNGITRFQVWTGPNNSTLMPRVHRTMRYVYYYICYLTNCVYCVWDKLKQTKYNTICCIFGNIKEVFAVCIINFFSKLNIKINSLIDAEVKIVFTYANFTEVLSTACPYCSVEL